MYISVGLGKDVRASAFEAALHQGEPLVLAGELLDEGKIRLAGIVHFKF